jgi:hypothetical protein
MKEKKNSAARTKYIENWVEQLEARGWTLTKRQQPGNTLKKGEAADPDADEHDSQHSEAQPGRSEPAQDTSTDET